MSLFGCGSDSKPAPAVAPTWQPAEFDAVSFGWLMSAWGTSATDLWAVGGRPGAGRVMHRTEAGWEEVGVPDGTPLLNWVFGFGTDSVFAVGEQGTVLRYDGGRWSAETSTTTEPLWGVWGVSETEMWAVGGLSTPTLVRRTDTGWAPVDRPPLTRPQVSAFFKIWGSSNQNVWVVGERGVVLHFDGTNWVELGLGTSRDWIALWGTGAQAIAVGGRSNGVIGRWVGPGLDDWEVREPDLLPGLSGIWTDGEFGWAAGVDGTLVKVDMNTGAVEPEPLQLHGPSAFDDFHAVFGIGATLWAVGGSLDEPGAFRGLAFRRELP